jgi:hypothetical protein
MTTETRDVLISAVFGLGFIFFFVSVFAIIWLFAYGVAKVRLWWDSRR